VYEVVRSTRSHPTAESIFTVVRQRVPKISLGTVYRNLSILKRDGFIREVVGASQRARYEANGEPHAHFRCQSCGEIRDVEGLEMTDWRTLKDLVGCVVNEQSVVLSGTCPVCQRKNSE